MLKLAPSFFSGFELLVHLSGGASPQLAPFPMPEPSLEVVPAPPAHLYSPGHGPAPSSCAVQGSFPCSSREITSGLAETPADEK